MFLSFNIWFSCVAYDNSGDLKIDHYVIDNWLFGAAEISWKSFLVFYFKYGNFYRS